MLEGDIFASDQAALDLGASNLDWAVNTTGSNWVGTCR